MKAFRDVVRYTRDMSWVRLMVYEGLAVPA